MGGGDLNSKKSWHPNTIKNQERVWKAEQSDAAEKKKLAELQREISDERNREELKRIAHNSGVINLNDDKKLEWMYKGPTDLLNREEYLLGRPIDKTFEQLNNVEQEQLVGVTVPKNHVEHECIPFSIRSYRGVQITEQVDMARKVMEDPLMAIKQKEMESRRKILENPVKLKELHRLLKHEKSKKVKKNKKDKKSKKSKSKKSKHSSDSNDSDGSNNNQDLDAILAKKYKKIQEVINNDEGNDNLDINQLLSDKYDKLSKELDKMGSKKRKKSKNSAEDDKSDYDDRKIDSRSFKGGYSKSDNRNDGKRRREYTSPSVNYTKRHSKSPKRYGSTNKRSRSPERYKFDNRRQQATRNFRNPEKQRPNYSRNYRSHNTETRRRSRTPDRGQRSNTNRKSSSRSLERKQRPRSRERDRQQIDRSKKSRSRSSSQTDRKRRSRERQDRTTKRGRSSSSSSESRSKSPDNIRSRIIQDDDDDDDSRKSIRKNYGLVSADGKTIKIKGKPGREITEEARNAKPGAKTFWKKPDRKHLTEEEKEQRRLEMMTNAVWRDQEREKYVKKYYADEKAQTAKDESGEFDRNFINKELHKAVSQETVESRIKSNVNNIQRSAYAMNDNFVRR